MKHGWLVVIAALALAGCPYISDEMKTARIIEAWSTPLDTHLSAHGNNGFPASLDQIDPQLRAGMSEVDAWGNKLHYRLVYGDAYSYNLISAGRDGELGNEDDIIMENGWLHEATTIYERAPIDR